MNPKTRTRIILIATIAGIGTTPDEAYDDFVRSWNELNGFEWIQKNKSSL